MADENDGKLKKKAYEKSLKKLQTELCRMQRWVRQTGAKPDSRSRALVVSGMPGPKPFKNVA